jgi:hypothetical protein
MTSVVAVAVRAMNLVDDEEIHRGPGQQFAQLWRCELFGSGKQKLHGSASDLQPRSAHLVRRQRAVDLHRLDAEVRHLFELIAHERNQRRDHDRHARHQHGRQLVAE